MRRAATLAMVLAASGCASHGDSVPTRLKTGQSWVITRQLVAAQVIDACARDSATPQSIELDGYWAPSREQIEQLEAQQDRLKLKTLQFNDFDRQYVGILAQGRQLIYINAFQLSESLAADPARTAVQACAADQPHWNALYEPQTGEFSRIQINGVLQPNL